MEIRILAIFEYINKFQKTFSVYTGVLYFIYQAFILKTIGAPYSY